MGLWCETCRPTCRIYRSDPARCEATACFYTHSRVINFAGDIEEQTTADCSLIPTFTFDTQLATVWPGPGAVTDACYLLQAKGNDTTLGCMCTRDSCNRRQPYPSPPTGTVQCHQTYNVLTDDALQANATCRGQYCLIMKARDVTLPGAQFRYTKGCLSVSGARDAVRVGHRNVLGVEQWFCSQNYCNRDTATAAQAGAVSSSSANTSPSTSDNNIQPNTNTITNSQTSPRPPRHNHACDTHRLTVSRTACTVGIPGHARVVVIGVYVGSEWYK